jgi:hypothetical protein
MALKSNMWLLNDDGRVKFVVGLEKTVFFFHKGLIMDISPVVKAALMGEFKEGIREEIILPQFDRDDFTLFLRVVASLACCEPPAIATPVLSDDCILSIAPISGYLRTNIIFDFMLKHVEAQPKLSTVIAVEEISEFRIQWGPIVIQALLREATLQRSDHSGYQAIYSVNTEKQMLFERLSAATATALFSALCHSKHVL